MEFSELFTQLLIDLQSVYRKNNKDLPMSLSQVVLLSSISADGIKMSDLAERVGVDNSTLTRLIDILEKKNLVQKKRNANDRRSRLIYLSKLGEENIKFIELNTDRFVEDILKNTSNVDRTIFKDGLNSLHWAITRYKLSDK
mgnify:CR=1 FL=1